MCKRLQNSFNFSSINVKKPQATVTYEHMIVSCEYKPHGKHRFHFMSVFFFFRGWLCKFTAIWVLALPCKEGTKKMSDFFLVPNGILFIVAWLLSACAMKCSQFLYVMAVVVMIPFNSNLITMNIVLPTLLFIPHWFTIFIFQNIYVIVQQL